MTRTLPDTPLPGCEMVVTHYDVRFYAGPRRRQFARFTRESGCYGKPDTKKPRDRGKDFYFNLCLGHLWARRMRAGGTRFNPALEKFLNVGCRAQSITNTPNYA